MAVSQHVPVLVDRVVEWLAPSGRGPFVDCTVGLGGHTRALLDAGATHVIGLDRDAEALAMARDALADAAGRVELVHADYRDLGSVLDARGVQEVEGVLADLGVSSWQLDTAGRGFSFRTEGPLDMRLDRSRPGTAADLVRETGERELADAIFQFGEERYSRRIARAIARARETAPLETTSQLADVVRRAIPQRGRQRIDAATRTFQALRIWVNRELDGLDRFVRDAAARLRRGARLVVITFHSLEDRVIKHTLRELDRGLGLLRVLTKRPETPSDAELERNPRARSAKLRAAERV
jgi:16S rRNA (cytosine1402-N4)-methyltransferase